MPAPSGCAVSTSTRMIVPGAKCWSRVRPRLRFFTGSGKRSMARSHALPSITSVPPAATKAFSAATPSSPMPPRYSGRAPGDSLPETMLVRLLVGEEDDVEPVAEPPGLHVRVVQRGVGELVLLDHPPRPAFVHAGGPRLVEAEARGLEGQRRAGRPLRQRAGLQSQRGRHLLHRLQRHAGDLHRRFRAPPAPCRGARRGDRRAGLQQPVDRDGALGAGVVEREDGAGAGDRAGALRRRRHQRESRALGQRLSSRTSHRRRAACPATTR